MLETKQRNLLLTLLAIYSLLIIGFMFLGFGRPGAAMGNHEYKFNLIPDALPLRFPNLSDLNYIHLWFFNFGNLAAFIPFGILVPWLYRTKFPTFILSFVFSILLLEALQMLTFLGSFDVNDVVINSLGAAIGFFAYKAGSRHASSRKKIIITMMCASVFSLGAIGFSELLNRSLTKVEGPIIALNKSENTSNSTVGTDLQTFEIGHEKIEPNLNVYSAEDSDISELTYRLNGKDILLSLNYGMPNNATNDKGEILITADGQKIEAFSLGKDLGYIGSTEIFIEKVDELTITMKSDVKLWDVAYSEFNYWWKRR